jgi:hypothetical protein
MTAPVLDGTAATGQASTTNTLTATLTTANANDIIVVMVGVELGTGAPTVSSVSGGGLTWTRRSQAIGNSSVTLEVWYAVAASPLTSVTITATTSANFDNGGIIAFGITGCNTASPWDSNASLPAKHSYSSAVTPSATISTTFANDFLMFAGAFDRPWTGYTPAPSGFSVIGDVNNAGGSLYMYMGVVGEGVTSVQSSQTFSMGQTPTGNGETIFDVRCK